MWRLQRPFACMPVPLPGRDRFEVRAAWLCLHPIQSDAGCGPYNGRPYWKAVLGLCMRAAQRTSIFLCVSLMAPEQAKSVCLFLKQPLPFPY